nr:hypothetical protein [Tanacetum cinerariifolium]
KEEGWNRIEEYVQYQDDLWDDPPPPMNVSFISEMVKPTFKGRLERACKQISYLTTATQTKNSRNPYLICKKIRGAHEADKCDQNKTPEQEKCLTNIIRGCTDNSPRSLQQVGRANPPTLKLDAPTFAITTRSGTSTHDPPYPTPPSPTTVNQTKGMIEKGGSKGEETTVARNEETPHSPTFYHPFKSSSVPFPYRLKKQKTGDEDERLLSIFRQILFNLPFLEAMIHMPKGVKVLKDLLSHKEKLEKAASFIKLSEEFLEMDEDELVPIILGRPFLATTRAVIDVHKRNLSLRVENETVTFNSGKSMRS